MSKGMSEAGREQMDTGAKPAWRAVVIAAAKAQAEQEARELWHLQVGEPLPFDARFEHVAQVTALALRLARALQADLEIMEAAGWLHDVRKQEPKHALAGAAAARTILAETDFRPAKIEAVVDVIRKHEGLYRPSGAPPLEPLEAAILWDADKLSKIGVQSVLATLSTPQVFGKDMAARWRYVAEFADKVLGRTVESMNTKAGRRMAERRYRSMLALLSLWVREAREAGVDLQGEVNFEISSDYNGLSEEQGG
jgi:HD superfamily phosphodiesterase